MIVSDWCRTSRHQSEFGGGLYRIFRIGGGVQDLEFLDDNFAFSRIDSMRPRY